MKTLEAKNPLFRLVRHSRCNMIFIQPCSFVLSLGIPLLPEQVWGIAGSSCIWFWLSSLFSSFVAFVSFGPSVTVLRAAKVKSMQLMIGISENSSLEEEVLEGIINNMLVEKVPMSSMLAEKVHMDRTGIWRSLQSHRDNSSPRENTTDNTMEILTLLQEVKQNLPTSGAVPLDKRS